MKVLVTDYIHDDNLERNLFTIAGIETVAGQCTTPELVIELGAGAEAMITTAAPVTREVLEALPDLRMITAGGTGVDHIDLEAARQNRIWVSNVPDASLDEEIRRMAVINVLSWWKDGFPPNVIVKGKKGVPLT